MVIAVTGLTGFLGSFLAKRLFMMDDVTIKALVRKESDIKPLKEFSEKISFIEGDLDDMESLAELVEGADVVVHAGYYSKEGTFTEGAIFDTREYLDVNIMGSHCLLEESKLAGVKQFIFISSCAVFGHVDTSLPLDEKHPLMPNSLYGAYKASVESLCHAYYLGPGMDVVIFRPVAIYGIHRQIEKSRWFDIIKNIKVGKDVEVSGGGKIVHVDEVVQAIILSVGNAGFAGNVYAVVDMFIDEMKIAEMAKEMLNSKSNISGVRKTQKNFMQNDKIKNLGVKFRGVNGLENYINDLIK